MMIMVINISQLYFLFMNTFVVCNLFNFPVYFQNPPAIPSLLVCYIVALLRNSHLVVDWHNYGYTILGLTLGPRNKLVQFSKWWVSILFFYHFAKTINIITTYGLIILLILKVLPRYVNICWNWSIALTLTYFSKQTYGKCVRRQCCHLVNGVRTVTTELGLSILGTSPEVL